MTTTTTQAPFTTLTSIATIIQTVSPSVPFTPPDPGVLPKTSVVYVTRSSRPASTQTGGSTSPASDSPGGAGSGNGESGPGSTTNVSAIAGGVVGGVALLVIILVFLFLHRRRKSKKKKKESQKELRKEEVFPREVRDRDDQRGGQAVGVMRGDEDRSDDGRDGPPAYQRNF